MSKEYIDLPERIKADFLNVDGDIVVDLRSTDSEYQDLYHRFADMKKRSSVHRQRTGGSRRSYDDRRGTRRLCRVHEVEKTVG